MRWPALLPEGSRRRTALARLNRPTVAVGEPLVTPLAGDPEPHEIQFAAPAVPLVSVVIPVYRKLGLTLRCLSALARADLAEALEVIVVDDASGDGTADAIRKVAGVVVAETPANVGYLRATNTGVAMARGEFVLLLNNDVEVHAGAIRALVDALQRDPSAGAAGARLLYADGSLQEAGSIIWADGSGWNYGKGGDPRSPEFAHVRPVDYCSAACLLVRRSALPTSGAFDDRYAPAYYEDSDLAFALRAVGLSTIYVPDALVLHHEGASHGTSVRTGVKAFQQRNRERFCEKWSQELRKQQPPSVQAVVVARDRRSGPRILVTGRTAAGAATLAESMSSDGAVVTFVVRDGAAAAGDVAALRVSGVEVWPEGAPGLSRLVEQLAPHLRAVVLVGEEAPPSWLPRSARTRLPIIAGGDAEAVARVLRQ
jgi:GT2 family glycosyltransferase